MYLSKLQTVIVQIEVGLIVDLMSPPSWLYVPPKLPVGVEAANSVN